MELLDQELARRDGAGLAVRGEAFRLRWPLGQLVAKDGATLEGSFELGLRTLEAAAERAMLAEAFLSGRAMATLEDVAAHFRPRLQAKAAVVARGRDGADLIEEGGRAALSEALQAEAQAIAFAAGLEVLGPFVLVVESPTLRQQRIEQMQQTVAERRFTNQIGQLERAGQLLRQFEQIRQTTPGMSAESLLKQMSPADQGPMLQMLLMATAEQAGAGRLWVVAGGSLVAVDAARLPATDACRVMDLPTSAGPLRSVQCHRDQNGEVLLVGARGGVLRVDEKQPQAAVAYLDPQLTSAHGFTSACMWRGQLWACHRDGGVVAWHLEDPQRPAVTIRPEQLAGHVASEAGTIANGSTNGSSRGAGGIRNLQPLDEQRLIFGDGPNVLAIDAEARCKLVAGGRSDVLALLAAGERVLVVREDGAVDVHARDSLAVVEQIRPAGAVSAAGLLPWLGSHRLLLADCDGAVLCIGLEDSLMSQYHSRYRGLRMLAARTDLVVAVTPDRQRLVLWHSWDPRQPFAEVAIWSIAKHRVVDVAIL